MRPLLARWTCTLVNPIRENRVRARRANGIIRPSVCTSEARHPGTSAAQPKLGPILSKRSVTRKDRASIMRATVYG